MGNSAAKERRKKLMELVHPEKIEELREFLAEPEVDVNARDDKTHYTALMEAALSDSVQSLKILLEAGANVNKGNKTGETPLMCAAKHGSEECTNALLAAGADVNKRNKEGCTALWFALESDNVCVEILINAGADVKMAHRVTARTLTKAILVANDNLVRLLLEAGVDPNVGIFNRPLASAAMYGHHRCMEQIVKGGADVNELDKEGMTVLQVISRPHRHIHLYDPELDHDNDRVECARVAIKAEAHVNIIYQGCNSLMSHLHRNNIMNMDLVQLLYAAGEMVDWPVLEQWLEEPQMGTVIPEWLRGAEARREECASLKNLCRVSIRTHLLHLDRHSSLFFRVPKLGLPAPITRYLLYNIDLDKPYTSGVSLRDFGSLSSRRMNSYVRSSRPKSSRPS